MDCAYCVEDDEQIMESYLGFKPFGEYFVQGQTKNNYRFALNLSTEPIVGLDVDCDAEIHLPPLPEDTKGREFLHDENFVTNVPVSRLLVVQRVDYQK